MVLLPELDARRESKLDVISGLSQLQGGKYDIHLSVMHISIQRRESGVDAIGKLNGNKWCITRKKIDS